VISQSNVVIAGSLRNVSKYDRRASRGVWRDGVCSCVPSGPEDIATSAAWQAWGAKVARREGNSPDRSLRCLNAANTEWGF